MRTPPRPFRGEPHLHRLGLLNRNVLQDDAVQPAFIRHCLLLVLHLGSADAALVVHLFFLQAVTTRRISEGMPVIQGSITFSRSPGRITGVGGSPTLKEFRNVTKLPVAQVFPAVTRGHQNRVGSHTRFFQSDGDAVPHANRSCSQKTRASCRRP